METSLSKSRFFESDPSGIEEGDMVVKKAKKKAVIELIRIMILQSDQMEPSISMFVQQTVAKKRKTAESSEETAYITPYIQKDLEKIIAPFYQLFTYDEILLLISFYKEMRRLLGFFQSETLRKLFKNRRKLFDPIYESCQMSMKDALQAPLKQT